MKHTKEPMHILQRNLNTKLILDNLLANLPSHIYWKDHNGIYLGCNDQQAQSLGFKSGKDVIGKTDFELPWDEQLAKRFWENDQEVLTTGQAKTVEEWAIINGQPAIVLSLKAPLKDAHHQVIGLLGISVDITERKKMEEKLVQAKEAAEGANYAKIEFLQNMRHDIRTPLVGITGCAQIIKDNIENPQKMAQVKECADHLLTSSQALAHLLNSVLESIKVAEGNLPLLKKRFNLEELLHQLIALNQARAMQKELKLSLHHDSTIPAYLIGDSIRLQRIILELLTNALNFTEHGYVKVTTQLVTQYKHTAIIKIIVEDTGVGIAQDKQQEVYTRFKRMTPSYQGIYKGVGLGLSIVKQYIDDFDGELYFNSSLQQGSCFTCVIPLKKALLSKSLDEDNPSKIPLATESLVTEKMLFPNLLVLLVEDDVITAKVTTMLLTKVGCTVDVAIDGKTALQRATSQNYSVIFLDIGLPDASGVEIAKQIRQWEAKQNKRTPIIALTAHVDVASQYEYQQSGIDVVLLKPLTQEAAIKVFLKFS